MTAVTHEDVVALAQEISAGIRSPSPLWARCRTAEAYRALVLEA